MRAGLLVAILLLHEESPRKTVKQGKAELRDGDRVLTTLFELVDSIMSDVTS